jgi:hypothetical protein
MKGGRKESDGDRQRAADAFDEPKVERSQPKIGTSKLKVHPLNSADAPLRKT